MKKIQLFLVLVLTALESYSQFNLSGRVLTADNRMPVSGANISINNSYRTVNTDGDGSFILHAMPTGKYFLTIKHLSYQEHLIQLNLLSDTVLIIQLDAVLILSDEVIISAMKVTEKSPFAFSELNKPTIESANFGQDVPYLLNQFPSVVTTSDAGNGVGYTGIRIRGTDASRINVTINGIPLNDAESQNVYWVDLPDMASSVENIQVQRGAGTSMNGAGAFGGSINIQTNKINTNPYAESAFSMGSFHTFKNNLSVGSGLLKDHWFMEGRLSKITSDGYIDRATSDLKSFYVSTGYVGKNTIVRCNIFSGKEITYQSWNGVPEARLNNDEAGMLLYIDRNYLSEADAANLLTSGRTYNSFTYENQVDDYQQDHFQLLISHQFNPNLLFNAALHYTKGKGFYEEYKAGQELSDYGLANIILTNDTISTTDLVRQKWLDNDFYGLTYSLNYAISKKQQLIVAGGWNQYDGDHFNTLKWLQWVSNSNINQHYYDDNALKTDFNIFAKYTFDITSKINIYLDQQYRSISYQFTGYDSDGLLKPQQEHFNFFNPKAGIYIKLSPTHAVFASFSVAQKEPSRVDFTDNTYAERPKSEQLYDYELGYRFQSNKILFQANAYLMDYKNQLVLKGDVNEVGNYTRINVEQSSRTGIEISGDYKITTKINLGANVTFSSNKINDFTDRLDNYDDGSKSIYQYHKTDLAFSPSLTGMGRVEYNPVKNFIVKISAKFIGKQYLDNTQNEMRQINDYSVFDVIGQYKVKCSLFNELTFGLLLNNIFNRQYVSNGYSYGYIFGGSEIHENFYYPQSGFNKMTQITIKF